MYCANFGREKYSKYISLLFFQKRSNSKPLSNFVLPFGMQIPFLFIFLKNQTYLLVEMREKKPKVHTLF